MPIEKTIQYKKDIDLLWLKYVVIVKDAKKKKMYYQSIINLPT